MDTSVILITSHLLTTIRTAWGFWKTANNGEPHSSTCNETLAIQVCWSSILICKVREYPSTWAILLRMSKEKVLKLVHTIPTKKSLARGGLKILQPSKTKITWPKTSTLSQTTDDPSKDQLCKTCSRLVTPLLGRREPTRCPETNRKLTRWTHWSRTWSTSSKLATYKWTSLSVQPHRKRNSRFLQSMKRLTRKTQTNLRC